MSCHHMMVKPYTVNNCFEEKHLRVSLSVPEVLSGGKPEVAPLYKPELTPNYS